MGLAVRKARADDGKADDDLGPFLAIVDSSTGCMGATAPRLPCKLIGRLREKKFVGRFRLRCHNEPSIMAVAEEVKAKMPDRVVVETTPRYTLSEQWSRRAKSANHALLGDWPWMVRYAGFCVTRYARGAGGIPPFWAANDRDFTQEIVPFADVVLFKILAPKHRGLPSGKRLHKGTMRGTKGSG